MHRLMVKSLMAVFVFCAGWLLTGPPQSQAQALNPNPPPASSPARLVFVHHSVGENWLNDSLFAQLNANNYYVTDTYYGWPGTYDIGSYTDIGQWYNWFLSSNAPTYLADLYSNTYIHESLINSMTQPAGPNTIVMFKSCFPNSGGLSGNPNDPPRISSPGDPNPIWGHDHCSTDRTTVSNIKGMYRDLLTYFAAHQDKLFILITPPPVRPEDFDASGGYVTGSAERARAINTWLVHHWLDGYPYNNVAVFDFFNVLTSNTSGGDDNDLGLTTGNHHRWLSGAIQHTVQTANDFPSYASGDSHPSAAGNAKATGEFLPLLNVAYNAWKGTGGRPFYLGRSPKIPAAIDLVLNLQMLSSPAFANGGFIPDKYTMRDTVGQNISIPLAWTNVPTGTQSFTLSMVDRLPSANNRVHWLAIDIPPSTTSLAEGATLNMPAGTVQLNNYWGDPHYWGPYPDIGSGLHPYEIKLYALNVANLALPVATDLATFQAALEGKVLETGTITGYYRID